MSDKTLARRTETEISFDGINISSSIKPYLLSLTFIDNEEDETDDLQIKLQDKNSIWLKKWLTSAVNAAVRKSNSVKTTSSKTYSGISAGAELKLYKVHGYVSSTSTAVACTITGTYYAWDEKLINGRIRITNYKSRVGISGQVTCWIDSSDISQITSAGTDIYSQTGLIINAVIVQKNFKSDGKDRALNCGCFELDSVTASGPPSVITIKASSLPYSTQIRQTRKYKAWENYTFKGIADEITKRNSMKLLFLPTNNPQYKRIEQFNKSDIEFLSALCKKSGFSLKVMNNILVIFDQNSQEKQRTSLTIKKETDVYNKYTLSVSNGTTQYTSCRVRYTNPSNGNVIEAIAKVDDFDEDAKNNQQLEIRQKVASIGEAKALAAKQLRLYNKFSKKATFIMPGNPNMVAGNTIQLQGFGHWNGKYIIAQSKHTIDSSGYTTQIQLRQTLKGY